MAHICLVMASTPDLPTIQRNRNAATHPLIQTSQYVWRPSLLYNRPQPCQRVLDWSRLRASTVVAWRKQLRYATSQRTPRAPTAHSTSSGFRNARHTRFSQCSSRQGLLPHQIRSDQRAQNWPFETVCTAQNNSTKSTPRQTHSQQRPEALP